MSTKPLLLEGLAGSSHIDSDELVRKLRREKSDIEEQLRVARREIEDLQLEKERIERSVKVLRQQLSPLHRALRAMFGEIELAVGEEDISSPASTTTNGQQVSPADDARWQSYKNTFPGLRARIIDALLAHREMNIAQLSALLKAAYSSVKDAVADLAKAGAVKKEGGKGGVVRLNR